MNLKELKEIIEIVSEKGFAEFEVERQGFRLRISRFTTSSTARQAPAPDPNASAVAAPSPTGPPLVSVSSGDVATWPEQSLPKRPTPAGKGPEAALHVIKSPIVGTFYRSSSPTSEPFVKVGDSVSPDTVVCIIEAMKLMNEIQADISGEIAQIYAENGQAVEYDQPLFGIKT